MLTSLLVAAALSVGSALPPAGAQVHTHASFYVEGGPAWVSFDGTGFVGMHNGGVVHAGQRVMLLEGSRGLITYPDGCIRVLEATGIHSVPATCKLGVDGNAGEASPGPGRAPAQAAAGLSDSALAGALALDSKSDAPSPISR